MPWMETSPTQSRICFVTDDRLGLYSHAELCAH